MMKSEIIIIQYLIENRDIELNINLISKNLSIDYKNVYLIIKKLEKKSIIKIEHFGKAKRIKLNLEINPIIFEAENLRKHDLLKNKNLLVMLNEIKNNLYSKFFTLLLYGSYAKNKQTNKSDIDLIFIVPNKTEEEFDIEIKNIIKSIPLPIHYLVFSENQFLEMLNNKELNVGKEAFKNNIILYGIENYYNLLKNG
jgi:predicted nucleotidyltransferase